MSAVHGDQFIRSSELYEIVDFTHARFEKLEPQVADLQQQVTDLRMSFVGSVRRDQSIRLTDLYEIVDAINARFEELEQQAADVQHVLANVNLNPPEVNDCLEQLEQLEQLGQEVTQLKQELGNQRVDARLQAQALVQLRSRPVESTPEPSLALRNITIADMDVNTSIEAVIYSISRERWFRSTIIFQNVGFLNVFLPYGPIDSSLNNWQQGDRVRITRTDNIHTKDPYMVTNLRFSNSRVVVGIPRGHAFSE